jgi:hypothetical protein
MMVYSMLFVLGMVCSSPAQTLRPDDVPASPLIETPKVDIRIGPVYSAQGLLTEIAAWLSTNFDLPAIATPPRIELVSSAKLATMRYEDSDFSGGPSRLTGVNVPIEAALQRNVVALYNYKTETIFLLDTWTGTSPAERSVVVHEMVNRLQNLANLEFECPQAREKRAYEAQNQWLEQFGTNLETEFELDKFTVLVSSACMY